MNSQQRFWLQLLLLLISWWAHLDVVEVDFSQAAVIVVDPLQSFLHVGGVGRLVREDLEGICFHHTCPKHDKSSRSLASCPDTFKLVSRSDIIRTVDALCVGDGACGAQSVVVLLVAHQRVHSEDGCANNHHKQEEKYQWFLLLSGFLLHPLLCPCTDTPGKNLQYVTS